MEIVPIFGEHLFAVQYSNQEQDELERLFDLWSDPEYLDNFFESNKQDLGYYQLDVEQAIEATRNEATELRRKILNVLKNNVYELDTLFQNLDPYETRTYELMKQKSKRRWLRIYAIRIDSNVYLITGGAIKLTLEMKDRKHTSNELDKMEQCRNYLHDKGVFDDDSFKEMLNE